MTRRTTPFGRIAAALAAAILTVVAGCSDDERPSFNGDPVDNATEVLEEADAFFVDAMQPAVREGLAAISEESRCYFTRSRTRDSRAVTGSLRCGPVRVLGEQPDHNWYALGVRSRTFTEGSTSLGLANDRLGTLLEVPDTGGAFRPDGLRPAPVSSVQAPQADRFPAGDFAMLIDRDTLELDAEWRWRGRQNEIGTPTMSFTVDASGGLKVLPGRLMKELVVPGEPVADVKWYLPPEQRTVHVWQVTIRATDTTNTTVLIDTGVQPERAVANLPCKAMPCKDRHVGRYYLIATGLPTDRAELILRTGDDEQVYDLATGREVTR